jgi:hypothetical protein
MRTLPREDLIMKTVSVLVVSVFVVGCAGQVVPEDTGKTSEAIDPTHNPPPNCSATPTQRFWLSTGKPGNALCIWNPDHFFSGQPVYNFIKHPNVIIEPQFVPCGPIISDLESSCYQETLAGLMQCENNLTGGNGNCQANANACLSTIENGCLTMQNMCEQNAYTDCDRTGTLDMNCYATLDGDCQVEGNTCASYSPSCENYELECEQTVSEQSNACTASVYGAYQGCIGSLGTCI